MFTLSQYLFSLNDPYGLFRSLEGLTPERDTEGRLCYSVGNAAVSFRVQYRGTRWALRCYFQPPKRLERIYGEHYYPRELFLYDTPPHGQWVSVVLTPWVEGEPLADAIHKAATAHDKARLTTLSALFDALACELLDAPWAHGDLKPENIIIDPDDGLHLIDRDAMFLPEMLGECSPELGTAAFQHPARTASDFDSTIDDFSVALISTALHALSLDPTLYDRYGNRDGLLIDTQNITTDPALQEILQLYEHQGDGIRYRIARTLLRRRPATLLCRELIHLLGKPFAAVEEEVPELYFSNEGLWGFRTPERIVIPPLYDNGYDFTEGLAAVRLGRSWHFIDRTGAVVLSCPPCEDVKPFRNGRATLYTATDRYEIDIEGRRV